MKEQSELDIMKYWEEKEKDKVKLKRETFELSIKVFDAFLNDIDEMDVNAVWTVFNKNYGNMLQARKLMKRIIEKDYP